MKYESMIQTRIAQAKYLFTMLKLQGAPVKNSKRNSFYLNDTCTISAARAKCVEILKHPCTLGIHYIEEDGKTTGLKISVLRSNCVIATNTARSIKQKLRLIEWHEWGDATDGFWAGTFNKANYNKIKNDLRKYRIIRKTDDFIRYYYFGVYITLTHTSLKID